MSRSNRYCSVPQCSSWEKKSSNINFHAFPQTGDKYRVWVEGKLGSKVLMDRQKAWQLKLKIGKPVTKNMKVCCLHFIDDDYFYRDSGSKQRKFLKKTAVPSRNIPVGSTITKKQPECSSSNSEILRQISINKQKLVAEECSSEEIKPALQTTSQDEIIAAQGQTIDYKTMSEQNTSTRKKAVHNCNCCVLGCKSKKGNNRAIHFHQFPKQDASKVTVTNASGILEKVDRRKAWENILLMGKPVTEHMKVCSLHFQGSDYLTAGSALQHMKAPKLKLTAVPSKNLPKRIYLKKVDRATIAKRKLRLEKQSALRDEHIIPQSAAEAIEHHDYCLHESISFSEEKIDFITPVEETRTSVTPHEIQQPIFESCTDPLKISDEEESIAFGKLVAAKHEKLNENQKMHAEILITKILHKAALNQLTEDTCILDAQSQTGNNYSSHSSSVSRP